MTPRRSTAPASAASAPASALPGPAFPESSEDSLFAPFYFSDACLLLLTPIASCHGGRARSVLSPGTVPVPAAPADCRAQPLGYSPAPPDAPRPVAHFAEP